MTNEEKLKKRGLDTPEGRRKNELRRIQDDISGRTVTGAIEMSRRFKMAKHDIKPASLVRRHTFEMPPPQLKSRNFPENELQMKIHDANVNAQRPNPLDPQK